MSLLFLTAHYNPPNNPINLNIKMDLEFNQLSSPMLHLGPSQHYNRHFLTVSPSTFSTTIINEAAGVIPVAPSPFTISSKGAPEMRGGTSRCHHSWKHYVLVLAFAAVSFVCSVLFLLCLKTKQVTIT